jgi:L,D-transpeptidase ErfK/SrfK
MKTGLRSAALAALCSLLLAASASGWFPRDGAEGALTGAGPVPVVGANLLYFIAVGESLAEIARANGVGYEALLRANPGVDPWLPEPSTTLLLPYAGIFPGRPLPGITVNLAEMRLYLLSREDGRFRIRIYPIGIGDEGRETPEGEFTIRRKVEKPGWTVPRDLRLERPELPAQVPPGPDNPLGDFWLEFSDHGHGLHGTNRPYGVGRRLSRGCIRLYPEDIRDLFRRVPEGTPVRIVYRPIKVGIWNGELLVEAHRDYRQAVADPETEVRRQALDLGWEEDLDRGKIRQALTEALGVPVPVASRVRIAGDATAAGPVER